jgi:hypothetical protein
VTTGLRLTLLGAIVLAALAAGCGKGSDSAAAPDSRFFAATSFWNAPIARDAAVDPQSDAYVAELQAQVAEYGVWINSHRFSTAIYTVPRGQAGLPVEIDRPSDMYTNATDAAALERRLAAVPIPPGARPAAGTDRHMVIWQPETDTMWELWQAYEVPRDRCPCTRPFLPGWHAAWGARIDRVSESDGVNPHPFGATASGLAIAGGLMRIDELRRGRIDHALALAIPRTAHHRIRPPATRTDGDDPRPIAIEEGTRLRLDPSFDLDSLELTPVARAMAEAAQRYGIVVRDRAGAVAFYAEDPGPTSGTPYADLFEGKQPSRVLVGFPWDRLQVLAVDR